ncbi:carbohydrate esterase family 8 protein [Aureobasidium subglaciale EXF-2481]|uniref:pectinesterase n=1 Tax=Aureobasidium subglaciale (strain EXF-2481) TaxID=1043005 RepID=A0A074ZHE7_AURSE|nr:carbohydrate esterase family 8 protein [Aureobasidium subglaciale EXF-2481]KEQ97991.1 carbohydrate esterase family 8 protein [Aureobasidium subglaciale EXF-2481]
MKASTLISIAGIAAVAVCQNSTISTSTLTSSTASLLPSTASSSSLVSSSSSTAVSSSISSGLTALTVATDGSAQFTAINAAINAAQNSGIPTVVVKAGTYSESIAISGTQTVTIIGPTASSVAQNQVVIIASGANGVVSIATSATKGVTFKNLNLTNTGTGTAPAVSIRGSKHGFYNCALISNGAGVYSSSYGTALIANSYIEGSDKLFYNYPTVYVYGSIIVPTVGSASIMYAKGVAPGIANNGNSTIVVDSSSVVQKAGFTNTYVYLAAPNGNYTQAIYRNSNLGSLIAPSGFYVSSTSSELTSSVSSGSIAGSSTVIASSSSVCATPTPSATLIVSQNGTACQYNNISAAIAALPNDSKPYTIYIKPGTYNEQISITRNGKVTLLGETSFKNDYSQNQVKIQFSSGRLTSAGQNEQTPVINSKKTNDNSGLALYNIDFINSYPQTANTAALAADFYGNNMAAYGCSFIGFQDTLLANKGVQVFSNCYVEGSVDFIWGFGTAYFYKSVIASNTKGACVSAQGRVLGTPSAYIFDSCYVTYTSTYGSTFSASFLGRPYSNYSTVVYKNSYLDKHINAAGWQVWSTSNPQTSNVFLGEYNNTGPGSWVTGTARVSFATNMTDDQVAAYALASWVGDTSFIDQAAWNYETSWSFPASTTTGGASSTSSGVSGPTSTSSINAHPDSGTAPPQYAVVVSADGQHNASFTNLTAALASLPNDNTNQTIFLYAGTYTEQIPSINRPGAVRVIGYTSGNPGQNYKDNSVTVTFARGLSVSPLPVGHNDAETATVATASNRISFYNVNFINSDNLDGLEPNYVTLAASIYGNDIGFYGCSFQGWQDTLLTGATAGYQYYESCYISGAIDFIWGYSKSVFVGCTIGAKRAKSAMTAQSRASASAIGGYIFDRCLFTAATDATVDLTNTVYLGRPYSAYALVVVKNSYLDSIINPSGWKIWSATDPRTDHITFAEYNNVGPGSWENNVAARQAFGNATLLTSDTYSLASIMDSTSWIDQTYSNSIVAPAPAVVNTTTPTNVTVSGSSSYNGTVPPTGALVVSKNAIDGLTTYDTIQAALNAAPTSSKTNATIFIYPGVYQEQLIVNKSGTTIFMGYSDSTDDYNKNQVTIQQSYGEDTQGTGSDVDAATVYATGNYFYAYNVNFRNNNGTQQNIASLGFAVKSSKYAFMHGCQIYGNQDTLYISGNMFTFKTYIEGNVDFIFGAGSGYFLNSTISPNEDGDSITAAKRATNTTAAGFVFDQCSIIPAAGSSGFKNVSLGRPWNNFARVLYAGCYLDDSVGSAGWTQWSKSSPQTDGVTFAEYHNFGPGSSTCNRASFSQQLSDVDVAQFQLANFFPTTSWIDFSVVDVQPFTAGFGSAPAACVSSSSSSSSMLSTSSSSSSVTLPLITTQITTTIVQKATTYTTLVQGDVTSTQVTYVTENDGTTVTPPAILKTSVVKATDIVFSTTTISAKIATVKSTSVVLSTVSASAKDVTIKQTSVVSVVTTVAGKDTTIKSTETDLFMTTVAGKTSTVKATSTVLATSTSSLKPVTVTENLGSLVTTTTKGTTITASCVPTAGAAKLFKRGLEARAAGTTTIFVSTTVISYIKTSVVTSAGSTIYTSLTSTSTIAPTSTVKAVTSTVLSTSFATSIDLITESAAVSTFTSVVLLTSVTTESASGSTVTSLAYSTALSTVSLPGNTIYSVATVRSTEQISAAAATVTSLKLVSSTTVVTAAQSTVTITNAADSSTTILTTLPASTTTVYKTSSLKGSTIKVTVTPAPATKTTIVKSTSTVFTTVSKTAKNAPACTD